MKVDRILGKFVGPVYRDNLSGAFNLALIVLFCAFASYNFDQLYAFVFSMMVIAVIRKHVIEYIEKHYVKRDT